MTRPFAITSRLGAEHRAAIEELLFFKRLQDTVHTRPVAEVRHIPVQGYPARS